MMSVAVHVSIFLLFCSFSNGMRPHQEEDEEQKVQISVHKSGHFQKQGHHQQQHQHHHHHRPDSLMSVSEDHHVKSTGDPPPPPAERVDIGDLECGKAAFAPSGHCPESCPYAAEMATDYCHFMCVKEDGCGTGGSNPNETLADEEIGACRLCEVEACDVCDAGQGTLSGGKEHCGQCMFGYYYVESLNECRGRFNWIFIAIGVSAIPLIIFGKCWFYNLYKKPIVNEEGVNYALQCRQRAMVLQGAHAPAPNEPWPFDTNLMKENVAGSGTVALFRFQGAVIIWAVVLLIVWCSLVLATDRDLFMLGLWDVKTPMDLCYRIRNGRELQVKFLWVKVSWLVFAYVFSTIGAIAYGVWMAGYFKRCDSAEAEFSDFVAVIKGVPEMSGDGNVEEILKDAVKDALDKKAKEAAKEVVAVSVGWDFHKDAKMVKYFLEEEVHGSLDGCNTHSTEHVSNGSLLVNVMAKEAKQAQSEDQSEVGFFDKVTNAFLARKVNDADMVEFKADDLKKALNEMKTAPTSYVIFETEASRDKALKAAAEDGGILINGVMCELRKETFEPESLLWHNLQVTASERMGHQSKGWLLMIITCVVWTVALYLPYAYYVSSYSYIHGDEPPHYAEYIFVGLVVGAQVLLFIAAGKASHNCHFHYEEETQEMYIVYYNAALVLNLVMDIVLQTILSYEQMVGIGARVADGRLLQDVWLQAGLQQTLESYPIQKAVGKLIFKYSFPCTFLLPFAAEPFLGQLGPLWIGMMMVGRSAKIKGENAEKCLELSEMEQGRYADCLFNLVLVCCVPFVAPGYLAKILVVFIISHLYIYWYDHWKTLRYCRKFFFVSWAPHYLGQQLFSIPVAMLLVALVFKGNQWSAVESAHLGGGRLQGKFLAIACIGAFVGHLVVHLLLLKYVVYPRHLEENTDTHDKPYSKVSEVEPASFLTTNPVQCLRSKYKFQHQPPLSICVLGKEHTMKPNPALGAFYDGAKQKAKKDGTYSRKDEKSEQKQDEKKGGDEK
mmetsp:Transcript_55062/g.98211  ORF Transcript_55062/g.98211 Transcript_55062/m.98211 type:complete len:1005 (+) Transcript_55062:121-3135(+)